MITGAFLAETAATVDNKLHVWGGVIESYGVSRTREFNLVMVMLTKRDSAGPDRTVHIEIRPPVGAPPGTEPGRLSFDVPETLIAAEAGFAYHPIRGTLPFDGRYVFMVSIGNQLPVAVPLTVPTPR